MGSVGAQRAIKKGEEILVSYGKSYWIQQANKERAEAEAVNAVTRSIHLKEKVGLACKQDKQYQQLIVDTQLGLSKDRVVIDGLVMLDGRICLPNNEEVKTAVLQEIHDTPIGGHLGRDKTTHTIKHRFYWEKMDEEIERYVVSCPQCQQNKVSHQKTAGLLMPIPMPGRPGQQISLDLIGQ